MRIDPQRASPFPVLLLEPDLANAAQLACTVIHRHGGDACIPLPMDLNDLIARLDAFQLRARPSF